MGDRDARLGQPLFHPAGRGAQGGPVRRPAWIHAVLGGDDVALRGERSNGPTYLGSPVAALQGVHNLGWSAPAVEKRQQIAMQAAVQQGVE